MTGRGYVAVLKRGDEERELGPDEVINPDIPAEHSVINEWRFETPLDESLEFYRHGELLLYFQDETGGRHIITRGPVDAIKSDDQDGVTRLRGMDVIQLLEQEGPRNGKVKADGVAAGEIERVWEETPLEANVVAPEPIIVSEERVIQSGDLTTVFDESLTGDEPVVVEDNQVRVAQVGWVEDAFDTETVSTQAVSNDDLVDGEGDADFDGGLGQAYEFDFTLDYDVPADELEIGWRYFLAEDEGNPGAKFFLDGQEIEEIASDVLIDGVRWFTRRIDFEVEAGTHTFRIEGNGNSGSGGSDDFVVDQLAAFDGRYTDASSDDEVHEPGGQLDRPQELPDAVDVVADTIEVENSIVFAYLNVDSDTENNQELGIEFAPDGDYTPDITAPNSISLEDENPGDPTSTIRGGITLGHTGAVRNDETPRKGWDVQTLTDWELAVDESSIIVFEDQEFDGNWFQIMQEMHDEGGLVFRTVPDENQLAVETFERGDLQGNVDWTRLSFERGYENATDYANVLTVVGAEDDQGNREVVEVRDDDEIDRIGEEIPDYLITERHQTKSELRNFGVVELNRRLQTDELSASLDIVPQRPEVGYEHYIPVLDESLVLERVTFTDGRQPSCTLDFQEIVDIATSVSGVRRESRTGRR